MPAAYDPAEPQKKAKTIKSAFESESFDDDWTIHVDGLVGSATISPSGRDVALASPEGLAIIDLDSPYSPPRRLSSRGLPWLVVDVQWSPFAARDYWVVSTANHRCLVWNLNFRDDSASGPIEHSLQGHSRAITDINFSAHHPDLLATCAVDGYVHNWDLRRPRQPALTFCDWTAGATQVKYSRRDPHVLASSHDRLLHIWDDRRAAEPVKTIMAHSSKIYGLDWNRTRPSALVTCSLDKSIKFWDYLNEDDTPERVIRTDFPVWRARHTPFGWGVLAMPQNEPGNLHLYDSRRAEDDPVDTKTSPVFVFKGHGNHKAKEFLWRSRGGFDENGADSRDFQLVSWGEDKELRLERVESEVLESVGYVKGGPAPKGLVLTRKGATYKTFRTVDDGPHRNRRNATMSDPRPSSSHVFRRSAISTGLNAPFSRQMSTWRPASMRAKTASRNVNRGQAQIGWMRGVTKSKRKTKTEANNQPNALPSGGEESMFGSAYHDSEWGEPETIQDEFVRISSQLPNVNWDHIDMDNLTINASLKGPWGFGGEQIFIKIKIDIPSSYPKSTAPRFFIEKTSFMPHETRVKVDREVHFLADQFLQRKKYSLGTAFAYLLGEVDLETSTSFLDGREADDDLLGGVADDESSSEDDESDIPPGGSAAMSQELPEPSTGMETTAALGGGFRQTVIPVKRTCGARFSNDGRLACFFPTKEEKANALFLVSSESAKERPKGEPRFAGFGRLAYDSPPSKSRHRGDDGSATDDISGSDDSDSSSSSSTDSELASMNRLSFWYRPGRSRFRKSWSANESVRSSGGGTGTGTGTHTGTGKGSRRTVVPKSKNIVALRDMRHLLPSKHQLAKEYAIFGDGAEVCEHNAQVAQRHGEQDLVDVWRYAALLLRSDIPLRLVEEQFLSTEKRSRPVLVIAREVVSKFHEKERHPQDHLLGRVKWGHHPLAHDFIGDVFAHFERLADVQMLAMLSCIFGDSWAEDGVAYAESHLTQPQTPLPMKAPSFSLEYFPTNPELWHQQQSNWQHQYHQNAMRSQASSAMTTPRTSQTPNLYSYSASLGSEPGIWPGDSGSYSCGETPPAGAMSVKGRGMHSDDQSHSLSTSPNTRTGTFRRSQSAITSSSLATSLPRMAHGDSPPDPPPHVRKKPSPAETIFNNLAPAVTWGASTVFGAAASARADAAASAAAVAAEMRAAAAAAAANGSGTRTPSVDGPETPGQNQSHMVSMVAVDVSVQRFNERLFDDDGWMITPFLDPGRRELHASYRYAYAEMLLVWGQPLARLEIMKFNVLRGDGGNEPTYTQDDIGHGNSLHIAEKKVVDGEAIRNGMTSPTLILGKRQHLEGVMASGRGLDVTGICRVHETNLEPLQSSGRTFPRSYGSDMLQGETAGTTIGGAVGSCDRCHVPQAQLKCVYCNEPVVALYPACLGCGCPSHEACLAEWHAAGERLCPAGDECDCAAEAVSGLVESRAAVEAALAAIIKEREKKGRARSKVGRSVRIDTVGKGKMTTTPVASPGVARPRRRSMPGNIGLRFGGDGEEEEGSSGSGNGTRTPEVVVESRDEWEKIAAPSHLANTGGTTTPNSGLLPQASAAAAHLSRLKKQVGEMASSRPGILRRKSERAGGALHKAAAQAPATGGKGT